MSQRKLLVVGGPNGAGKTTFAEEYLSGHACRYLSADLIAAEMSPGDPSAASVAAGRMFLTRLSDALKQDEDLIVESTLSGRTFRRFLDLAKTLGWQISLVFVYVDCPETSVARVQERVRRGGHDVPRADIQRRFLRSLSNFWTIYREFAENWSLYYNSRGGFENVAIGSLDSTTIRDDVRFRQFRQAVDEFCDG